MVKGHLPSSGLEQASALLGAVDVASIANCNLSEETKELLHLHFCLGHVNFKTLSGMVRHRNIQVQSPKLAGNVCPCPKCAACEFGKAVRQGSKATTAWHDPDRDMDPKKSILHAGQHVASDHCQFSLSGHLCSSRSGASSDNMFHGGVIFVDFATKFIEVHHQASWGSSDTIRSKLAFKHDAQLSGVEIQTHQMDNGIFTPKELLQQLLEHNQCTTFSRVDAAHQNGVAEKGTCTIMAMACT